MDECMVPFVCQGLGKLLVFLMWKQFEGGSLLSITTVSVALRSVKLLRVNETVIASVRLCKSLITQEFYNYYLEYPTLRSLTGLHFVSVVF